MNDFVEYALSFNPGLLHVYNQGHLLDLSPNGNDGSLALGEWRRNTQGHLLAPSVEVAVPSAASLQMSAGTWLVFGLFSWKTDQYLISKSGVKKAGSFYTFHTGAWLYFSDGVAGRRVAHGQSCIVKMFGVTFVDTAIPIGYVNGASLGVMSGTIDIDATSVDPVLIGATLGGGFPITPGIGAALMIASVLTDIQIADLYRLYLEDARGVPSAPRHTVSFLPQDKNNALLYLAGPKDSSGNIIDQSPSGLDSAVTGRVSEVRESSSGARGQQFHGGGQGVVTVPGSALLTGHAGHTYSLLFCCYSRGELNGGRVCSLERLGGATGFDLFGGAVGYTLLRTFDDGIAVWNSTNRQKFGHTCHLLINHDGVASHVPTGLINGRPCVFTVTVGKTGTLVSDVGGILHWGNISTTTVTLDGTIAQPKFFGGAAPLTDEQARAEYLQHATRMIELAPRRSHPVTLANKTSGRVGPWDIINGTWGYQDDGVKRQLVAVTTGSCVVPSSQAYGAWYWRSSKDDLSTFYVHFIASARLSHGSVGLKTYAVSLASNEAVRLYRWTGAVPTAIFDTGPNYITFATEYEWFLTRAYDGFFVLWVRGGIYTSWTFVDSGTDNVYTESNFFLCKAAKLGDMLADVRFYPLGDTLDPRTEVPGLED